MLILLSLLASCSIKTKKASGSAKINNKIEGTVKGEEAGLVNTVWILSGIKGSKIENPAPGLKEAYIVFLPDSTSLTGSGSCNSIFGNYHLKGINCIEILQIGSTKMFCEEMETEYKMINALREATSFKINGDSLVMIKGNKIKLLSFIAKKTE